MGVGVGNGGSVPIVNVVRGVPPGVRVGTAVGLGVGDGEGDGEGVGQGSGPTRFQVYRPYVCLPAIASRTHWSVYFWNAPPRVSLMLIATFDVPSGCAQPATNQSSAFAGSVPLMNHSVDENGE